MKNIFLTLSIALCAASLHAETVTISAGQHLADLISADDATITELIVVTEDNTTLNADDMTLIAALPALEALDLRGVGYERANNCPGINNNKTIKEIYWPNNVSFIGNTAGNAFEHMYLPAAYNNPSALTRLFNNRSLVSLEFYEDAPSQMESLDGVIYGWGNTMCYYPSGKQPEGGIVVIPEGITGIMSIGSLGYNQYIKAIHLPATFNEPNNMRFLTEQNTNLQYIYVAEENPYLMTLFNDGCLYSKTQKAILWTSPVAKFNENLVIDGSLVESIPAGFLNNHTEVKHIKFTEGYKSLIYGALKGAKVETVELPASLESIAGEAMHTMSNLTTIICNASTDPLGEDNEFFQVSLHERSGVKYIGWTTFYGQPSNVKVCVPAGSRDLYLNSGWSKTWTHPNYDYTNNSYGYTEEQFVEPIELNLQNGEAFHSAVVAGMKVPITAKNPALSDADLNEAEYQFVEWRDLDAEPEEEAPEQVARRAASRAVTPVVFDDPTSEATSFTMPDRPVNIQAYYRYIGPQTSINTVDAAETELPAQYYNLQGMPVDNPTSGLYIMRRGNKATKVMIK